MYFRIRKYHRAGEYAILDKSVRGDKITMENWFTVENIDNDTFAISEYQHWEETHCYLVCGTQKAVLIDRIEKGFRELAHKGKLRQGNGVFDFGGFQIHI